MQQGGQVQELKLPRAFLRSIFLSELRKQILH